MGNDSETLIFAPKNAIVTIDFSDYKGLQKVRDINSDKEKG